MHSGSLGKTILAPVQPNSPSGHSRVEGLTKDAMSPQGTLSPRAQGSPALLRLPECSPSYICSCVSRPPLLPSYSVKVQGTSKTCVICLLTAPPSLIPPLSPSLTPRRVSLSLVHRGVNLLAISLLKGPCSLILLITHLSVPS